ncbi:MAG TPA: hypothetical protein PK736_04700 [Bacteroidia bacterium]|nr:hypothetical protein [Bacteroidota bacterium]HRC32722.1 hypothetical protein [Bacteroidia bacterium]
MAEKFVALSLYFCGEIFWLKPNVKLFKPSDKSGGNDGLTLKPWCIQWQK